MSAGAGEVHAANVTNMTLPQDSVNSGPIPTNGPPPGFYADQLGRERWWDGAGWKDVYKPTGQPAQPEYSYGPMSHGALNVRREVSYVRPQTPHSFTKHLCFGWLLLWIPSLYYAMSPNHYYTL